MGYRKLSARPRHHAQAEGAIEAFKKTSPPSWRRSHARTYRVERHRNLVPGRSPDRAKEQDHAALGQARAPRPRPRTTSAPHPPISSAPSAPMRQGLRPGPALLQHRGDECHLAEIAAAVAPGAQPFSFSIRPAGTLRKARRCPATSPFCRCRPSARTQPRRERLAVHARQLALQPRLQVLRRDRRPVLRRLEPPRDQPWRIMSIGLRDWAHGF